MYAIRCRCKSPTPGEKDPTICQRCARPILRTKGRSRANTESGRVERVHHAGHSFMSQFEARLYDGLLIMEKAGVIKDIETQVRVSLTRAGIGCIPDFRVFDLELMEPVYHEAKGFETERWQIILKLWRCYGPGRLVIWKSQRDGTPFIKETVIPNPGPSKLRLAEAD
jgi:hypothetical protein